jgi:dephospho-CoA kinase
MKEKSPVSGQLFRPLIIGLTGSIGMGKSTVAEMLREEGVPLFDADAEVHRLQAKGGACADAIESVFPNTTGADGGIDRARLGPMVFGRPEELKKLEAILHPAVGKSRMAFLAAHKDAKMICFDIPLLFETKGERNVDVILVVSAPADVQRARVLARPNMTPEKFAHILSLQTPDSEKRLSADFIIENHGSLSDTRDQLREILAQLRKNYGKWLARRDKESHT